MSFEGKQNTTVHIERYQIDPGVKRDIYKRNSASASGLERRHDHGARLHTPLRLLPMTLKCSLLSFIMTARSATDYLSIRTNVCGRFVSAGIQEDRTFSLYYAIC